MEAPSFWRAVVIGMVQCLADAFFLSLAKFGPSSACRVVAQSPRSCVGIGEGGGGLGEGALESGEKSILIFETFSLKRQPKMVG